MAAPLRILACIAALLPASAWFSGEAIAADITLMCPPPMRAVITDLVAAFERASGHTVTIVFAPSKTIIAHLDGRETVDIAILTAPATDALIKAGRLARRIDLARSTIGVAVRHGASPPDIGSADAFRRTLLAAKSFARNDGADSGVYMKGLIERLGIAEQMKPKTTLVPSGYVAELVARGEVELGAQQVSELMSVAGVDVTPLPAELQHVMIFSAGIATAPASAAAVDALLKFLTAPAAAPFFTAHGLDPA